MKIFLLRAINAERDVIDRPLANVINNAASDAATNRAKLNTNNACQLQTNKTCNYCYTTEYLRFDMCLLRY